ncbi:DNA-binding LacI/PurR family transcriptional regulator [Erwinia aphidicola]|nr:DNA-binding LacI/PurR family transcriptional regulator [Erwinia aphidicola]
MRPDTQRLLQKMADPSSAVQHIILPPLLIERGSA